MTKVSQHSFITGAGRGLIYVRFSLATLSSTLAYFDLNSIREFVPDVRTPRSTKSRLDNVADQSRLGCIPGYLGMAGGQV